LESTKAIPWKIDWATMKFAYIGPQIEKVLGWPQSSWNNADDWAARIHEDDRARVAEYCISKSKEGEDHEADYKALTIDGTYVWIRDVVHVVRKENGDVESLIGFMFDISEHKKTEAKLLELQKQLEEFSYKDGLTGVANRRMFDSVMQEEWMQGYRNQQPLSLIMFDIDYFKQYNDFYGHVQGDETLKLIASILNDAGTRNRDFFARFGGEEFALILPETDKIAAIKMAERCRNLVFKAQIAHAKSEVSQMLTISIGVDTIYPTHDDAALAFIDAVDKLMYQAKENGRNCIVNA
jgi:diguanylate cyclase (GGDEF)-like protein/PAS domain S-box-containing protein